MDKKDNNIFFLICVIFILIMFILMWVRDSHAQLKPAIDDYVNAIFKAEGGESATYLYGIRSIPYDTPENARKYCYNTVYNTLVKYRATRCKDGESDLDCLARRYCPLNVANDPKGLNKNWKSNVKYFLTKGQQ